VLSAAPSLLSMNLGHDIVVWQSRPTRATTLASELRDSCESRSGRDKGKGSFVAKRGTYGALRQAVQH